MERRIPRPAVGGPHTNVMRSELGNATRTVQTATRTAMFTTREVTTRKLTEGVEHLANIWVSHFLDHAMPSFKFKCAAPPRCFIAAGRSSLPRASDDYDSVIVVIVIVIVVNVTATCGCNLLPHGPHHQNHLSLNSPEFHIRTESNRKIIAVQSAFGALEINSNQLQIC